MRCQCGRFSMVGCLQCFHCGLPFGYESNDQLGLGEISPDLADYAAALAAAPAGAGIPPGSSAGSEADSSEQEEDDERESLRGGGELSGDAALSRALHNRRKRGAKKMQNKEREQAKHTAKWDSDEVYRLTAARMGKTRLLNSTFSVPPWVPDDPHDPPPDEFNANFLAHFAVMVRNYRLVQEYRRAHQLVFCDAHTESWARLLFPVMDQVTYAPLQDYFNNGMVLPAASVGHYHAVMADDAGGLNVLGWLANAAPAPAAPVADGQGTAGGPSGAAAASGSSGAGSAVQATPPAVPAAAPQPVPTGLGAALAESAKAGLAPVGAPMEVDESAVAPALRAATVPPVPVFEDGPPASPKRGAEAPAEAPPPKRGKSGQDWSSPPNWPMSYGPGGVAKPVSPLPSKGPPQCLINAGMFDASGKLLGPRPVDPKLAAVPKGTEDGQPSGKASPKESASPSPPPPAKDLGQALPGPPPAKPPAAKPVVAAQPVGDFRYPHGVPPGHGGRRNPAPGPSDEPLEATPGGGSSGASGSAPAATSTGPLAPEIRRGDPGQTNAWAGYRSTQIPVQNRTNDDYYTIPHNIRPQGTPERLRQNNARVPMRIPRHPADRSMPELALGVPRDLWNHKHVPRKPLICRYCDMKGHKMSDCEDMKMGWGNDRGPCCWCGGRHRSQGCNLDRESIAWLIDYHESRGGHVQHYARHAGYHTAPPPEERGAPTYAATAAPPPPAGRRPRPFADEPRAQYPEPPAPSAALVPASVVEAVIAGTTEERDVQSPAAVPASDEGSIAPSSPAETVEL